MISNQETLKRSPVQHNLSNREPPLSLLQPRGHQLLLRTVQALLCLELKRKMSDFLDLTDSELLNRTYDQLILRTPFRRRAIRNVRRELAWEKGDPGR